MVNYVKAILNFAKSRKISFSNVEILFCGGGSIQLRPYLLQELPFSSIIADAQFANVLSFLQVLEARTMAKRKLSISFKEKYADVYHYLMQLRDQNENISDYICKLIENDMKNEQKDL